MLFCLSFRQMDYVRSVDAEEDVQDFRFFFLALILRMA